MTAPSIVSGHVTFNDTTNTTGHTINAPTNIAGDVIYIACCSDANSDTLTAPSGFSTKYNDVAIVTVPGGSKVADFSLFYKTSSGSEPSTYTVTSSVSERCGMVAWAVRGDGGFDATGTNANGDSATATVPAVTTTQANCLRISIIATDQPTIPHGTPAGHTKLGEAGASSSGSVSVHYKTLTSSGTDSSQTASLNISEQWIGLTFAIAPAASGTTYNQSGAGTLTSAGSQSKQTTKNPVGILTNAGALAKSLAKSFTGIMTSSGGQSRQTSKIPAGTLTSGGALIKSVAKSFTGELTSSGNLFRLLYQSISGSFTLSGGLINQAQKLLDGSITYAGSLVGQAQKVLEGGLTSSGAVSLLFGKILTGMMISAGAVVGQAHKVLAGVLTYSSLLARETKKLLSGGLSSSGLVNPLYGKILAGVMGSSGAISRQSGKVVSGTLTSTSTLFRKTGKLLNGILTSTRTLTRKISKLLSGVLTSAGDAFTLLIGPVYGAIALTVRERRLTLSVLEREQLTVKKRSRSLQLLSRMTLTLRKRVLTLMERN